MPAQICRFKKGTALIGVLIVAAIFILGGGAGLSWYLNSRFESRLSNIGSQISEKVGKSSLESELSDIDSKIAQKVGSSRFASEILDLESKLSQKVGESNFESELADIESQIAQKLSEDDLDSLTPWEDENVSDDITASSYLQLSGGTLTGTLVVSGVSGLTTADLPSNITAANALKLAGETSSYYLNASNISLGTLSASRLPDLSSTYLSVSGGTLGGHLGLGGYYVNNVGQLQFNDSSTQTTAQATTATYVVCASNSKNIGRCDYQADGTEDQIQIQAAIDALPSGGGKVVLSEGNYTISEPITVAANNITIEGEGENTVLTEEDAVLEADYGIISASNAQYFVLRDLKLDGNKANQSGYAQTPSVVGFSYVTYGLVENIHLLNSMGDGVEPTNSTNITVRGSHIHDCIEHAIHYNGVTNGWILGNYLHDDGNSLIAQGHGGVKNVIVSNNILERANSGSFMIQVSGNDTGADMRERVYVTNNIMDLNGGLGIYVAEGATHILIAHNDIRNGGGRIVDVGDGAEDVRILYNDAEDSSRGIRVYGSHNYVVGNTLRNSEEQGNYAFEIYGDHHLILDNKIDGIAYYGYSPIELYATNTYVMRNYCKQRADKPSSEYGIEEKGSADDNYIVENDLSAGTWSVTPILTIGSSTIVRDNLGYATHNSGTATVVNGQTAVDVTHSLAITPAASNIQVTPTNDLGNAAKFWISDVGASTFRINVDADPGGSTATFSWRVAD